MSKRLLSSLLLLALLPAWAEAKPKKAPAAKESAAEPTAAEPAGEDAGPRFNWQPGPKKIDLGHQLGLDLPDDHVFLGPPDAATLMSKIGSFHNENLLGVVMSKNEADDYFVVFRFEDSGFVKDDEKIDADELLKAIKEGTEEANEERAQKGFAKLRIDGWSEQPKYEKTVHHLVWALLVGDDKNEGASVNFNTRVLGRRGYVSVNLVTDPAKLAAHKPVAEKLLKATAFQTGARYQDFDKNTDKVAEYGLVGLILGGAGLGAAKLVKVGLFAKFFKVIIAALIAGKKAIFLVVIGLGAALKGLFRKKDDTPPPPPPTSDGA